jgi:PBSX family phage terminase large subunit
MEIILPAWRKIINESFIPLVKNTDRYLICIGGRGSSKSVFAAKKLIKRCLSEPYFRYILYRKTYNTIKDSQFQTIKDIVYDWGLQDLFTFNVSPLEIRCINGNRFICRGGDDPKKLKSIKDPTGVWYEEEIPDVGDFITITTSIRTQKAQYLQEIFTVNPEVEGDYSEHWFYKRFFADKPEHTFSDVTQIDIGGGKIFDTTYTVHYSTHLDNRWLPDSFRAQLLALKNTDPYYYTIYVLGKWGNKTTDGNFYKLFKRAKNVLPESECKYNPDLALHVSFDFNVHPYVTITIHQAVGKRCVQIDEICLPTPNNRTDLACREFCRRYADHTAGVFVYGDPAGLHEDTRTEKGHNDFRIIGIELQKYRPQMRYQKSAPSVVMRGMFINAVFDSNYGGLTFAISEKCTNTIADYMFLKEASDGTKSKQKVKNPETGVSYEKYGHCFVGETMITTISGSKRIDEIQVNDLVLTRNGYKKVISIHDNGIKHVNKYKIGGRYITCTPNHHFYTKEHGFIEINKLIVPTIFTIFDGKKICQQKLLITQVTGLSETHFQKEGQTGFTIHRGLLSTVLEKKKDYIVTNGLLSVAKYLKGLTYTTLMKIHSIMIFQTSNVKIHFCTSPNMESLHLKNYEILEQTCYLPKHSQKRQNGTNQMKVKSGTKSTLKVLQTLKNGLKFVKNVSQSLQQKAQWKLNFAVQNAKQDTICELIGLRASGTKKEIVSFVQPNLKYTDGLNSQLVQELAQQNLRQVYDITVEDEHEYFANGILVHNCSDSNDYMFISMYNSEYINYQRGDIRNKPVYTVQNNRY